MTNYSHCSNRERLEALFNKSEQYHTKKPSFSSILKNIWQQFLGAMARGNEPRVWQRRDRTGKTWWHGYDPVSGRSTCLASEAEMRMWLEERYYQ